MGFQEIPSTFSGTSMNPLSEKKWKCKRKNALQQIGRSWCSNMFMQSFSGAHSLLLCMKCIYFSEPIKRAWREGWSPLLLVKLPYVILHHCAEHIAMHLDLLTWHRFPSIHWTLLNHVFAWIFNARKKMYEFVHLRLLVVAVDLQAFICQEGRLHKNKYASLRRANLSCGIKLQMKNACWRSTIHIYNCLHMWH